MKHKHFLGLLASILVGSSAYGTVTEEFTPPLQRAEWFTFAPSEKEQSREWIREIHVPEQLYFRYLGERVKSVEIFREGGVGTSMVQGYNLSGKCAHSGSFTGKIPHSHVCVSW